jgi:myosin heavy chain 9/10/11/14
VQELSQSKKKIQEQANELQAQLDTARSEISGVSHNYIHFCGPKINISGLKRHIQTLEREGVISSTSASAAESGLSRLSCLLNQLTDCLSDMRAVIEAYQAKEKSWQEANEVSEIARAKAARAEASGNDLLFQLHRYFL